MKKRIFAVFVCSLCLLFTSCSTHTITMKEAGEAYYGVPFGSVETISVSKAGNPVLSDLTVELTPDDPEYTVFLNAFASVRLTEIPENERMQIGMGASACSVVFGNGQGYMGFNILTDDVLSVGYTLDGPMYAYESEVLSPDYITDLVEEKQGA